MGELEVVKPKGKNGGTERLTTEQKDNRAE